MAKRRVIPIGSGGKRQLPASKPGARKRRKAKPGNGKASKPASRSTGANGSASKSNTPKSSSVKKSKSRPSTETSSPKRGPGRPRIYPDEASRKAAKLERVKQYSQRVRDLKADIAYVSAEMASRDRRLTQGDLYPYWESINWERRLACKASLKLHCETYHKPVFYLGWSTDQLRCVTKAEEVMRESGELFALAMPRGSGKTAICRASIQWGTGHAFRRYPFFVGSTDPKTKQTLESVKTNWFRNRELKADFPEICWPVERIQNRFQLAHSQTYMGVQTAIQWAMDAVRYPSMVLPREIAEIYLRHDPDSLLRLHGDLFTLPRDDWEGPVSTGTDLREDCFYLPASAGIVIGTAGISGSFRGEAETHPITLEQPRPDLVLLDDVQKDAVAESPTQVDKIKRLIDGAVQGLAGPGEHIAALMPCTVIMENDASDHYLEHADWNGERCRMVLSWPPGVTDYEITQDTEASKCWLKYADIRRTKGMPSARSYYAKRRKIMDEGFTVSWDDRYTRDRKKKNWELSAQQHAMNLRLKSPDTFLSEFQNIGKSLLDEGELLITADQLRAKTVSWGRLEAPAEMQRAVAFVDVQNEAFYWMVMVTDMDYNSIITDYGVWPKPPTDYFTKSNCDSWSLLTRAFFEEYPQHRDKAIKTAKGYLRAPLEAKIYYGLSKVVPLVMAKQIKRMIGLERPRKGAEPMVAAPLSIERCAVDTRWGQAADSIKRYIKESGIRELVPYYGQSFPPTNRQLEEYEQRKGWMFEQQVNPEVREPRWVIRPNPDGMFYMASDVDRGKDFLFQRLGSPPGSQGSLSLFNAPAERHQLLADHICRSEYPEVNFARNLTKNVWFERENAFDNDYLDCAVGCLQMASMLGVSLKTPAGKVEPRRRSLRDVAGAKREARA